MAKKARQRSKGTGTLILRGKSWFARWTVDGKLFTRTTGTGNRRLAEVKLAEFVAPFRLGSEAGTLEAVAARLGGVKAEIQRFEDEKPTTTIMHGWQAYLDQTNRPDSGESTLRQYEFQYEAFAKWFCDNIPPEIDKAGHPAVWELRQVTQEHADAYAGHLIKKVSPSTFNRHVRLLALVWKVLEKTARLSFNPWKAIGHRRFTVHSRRELTIEELQKVCETAQGEMRLLLALGIYCGLRLGDAACLEWGNVDMVKGVISLVPMKTARRSQKRVTLPIHRTLFAMMDAIPPADRKGCVMPSMAARYRSFNSALVTDISKLLATAGIIPERPKSADRVKGAPRRAAEVGYHSLRHTFVSLCAAGGVSQSVVQSLVGHGSPAMTQHYTHVALETAQNAVALLPDVTLTVTPAEQTGATGATVEGIGAMLASMTTAQLKDVVKLARGLIGKLEKAEVTE